MRRPEDEVTERRIATLEIVVALGFEYLLEVGRHPPLEPIRGHRFKRF